MKTVNDIRNELLQTQPDEDGMVELINVSFVCDEDSIFREPNKEYIERELEWYKSMSLNVNDIPGKVPLIWTQVADESGLINSNYGWCIWSEDNHYQYESCIKQLLMNKNTRRAMMIYTRPSIQHEYNKNGMSDFLCTNTVQVFIRNNKLIYIVAMRSNDAIFGFPNDLGWHKHVYSELYNDLLDTYPELETELIHWNVGSLHVYPRHTHLLEEYQQLKETQ